MCMVFFERKLIEGATGSLEGDSVSIKSSSTVGIFGVGVGMTNDDKFDVILEIECDGFWATARNAPPSTGSSPTRVALTADDFTDRGGYWSGYLFEVGVTTTRVRPVLRNFDGNENLEVDVYLLGNQRNTKAE